MPRGGRRPGAGRPPGSKSHGIGHNLPPGMGAIKKAEDMMKEPRLPKALRVPKDATEEEREVAEYGLQRILDVAAGRVHSRRAPAVLKGAIELRREVCGPIAQKVDVDVRGRLEHLLTQSLEPEKKEPEALPPPAKTTE